MLFLRHCCQSASAKHLYPLEVLGKTKGTQLNFKRIVTLKGIKAIIVFNKSNQIITVNHFDLNHKEAFKILNMVQFVVV